MGFSAPAQAQTEVWSATLTVKELSPNSSTFGCTNTTSSVRCSDFLSEDEFTYDSTDYAITAIFLTRNAQLQLHFDTDLTTAAQTLTLDVAGTTFAFEAAHVKGAAQRSWSRSGLSWSADDAVVLKLTETPATTNNAPVFTDGASTTRSVAENTASSTNIGTAIAATDADSGDTLRYTLGGTDMASFAIVSTSGQLQTRAALDFETKSSYAVTVSVSDGNGGSDSIGVTITVTDVNEQPGRPAAPSVGATANVHTSLDVRWTAPGLNGGPALTGYDLQYRQGTTGPWTNGPQNVSGTSAAIAGLAAGTSYQVQVRALNGETPSDWSPAGTGSTLAAATAPEVPRTLAAAPGDGQVVLTWTVPANTVSAILRYEYRSKATSSLPFVSSDSWASAGTSTTATVGSLTNATPYSFQVRAVNTVGAGPAATTSATPAGTATDPTLTLDVAPTRFGEAAGSAQICVVPSAPSTQRITVQVATADGTATAPGDYVAHSGTVALQPQQQRACFTVTLVDDAEAEGDETFTVRLSNPVNATLGGARAVATFTIVDNDDTTVATDRAALVAFYNATGGANWTFNANWLSNEPLSAWHGVETNAAGRVTFLGLPRFQLNGEIPAELGNLDNLQTLSLFGNQLSGEIPAELGQLINLQGLHLYQNTLSGEIPAELGNLANLEALSLYDNQLSGEIPAELGNLANLVDLYLSQNTLSGEIPVELGGLTDLVHLYLWGNELSGEIPAELGGLTSLQRLELARNTLSGEIPVELGDLANLELLTLSSNMLTGGIPVELGNLANLQRLSLRGNQLDGEIPEELGSLANLEELYLNDNQLSGEIPEELGNLGSLQVLSLSRNTLSGEIPEELGDLTSLYTLYLHNNQLSGAIPNFLATLSNNNLLRLSLYGNAGLYGYPTGLHSNLRLLAPGNGDAICLPSTMGGSDCTIPTLVDKLRVTSSPTQLVFTWAPNPDGYSGGYSAQYYPPPSGPWTDVAVTGTTATLTGLTPEATYSFLVRTVDNSTTPRLYYIATLPARPPTGSGGGGGGGGGPTTSAPGAVRNLMVAGGNGQVVLTWRAPSSDGGAAITDYEYRINRRNPWISTGSTETTHTVTGLDNGTAYTFEVRAVNRIGRGRASSQTEATPVAPEVFTLGFAHFANGDGLTSDLVFVNVSTQWNRLALYFYDTEGNPIAAESVVDVTGDLEVQEDGGLTVLTEMEPLGELTIPTHGRGDLVSGSVKVWSRALPSAGCSALTSPTSAWPWWGPAYPSATPSSRCAARREESTRGLQSTTWKRKR